MPGWDKVAEMLNQIRDKNPGVIVYYDNILKEEISKIRNKLDGQNIIFYASGFLQNHQSSGTSITREDINGFMNACHGLDFEKI